MPWVLLTDDLLDPLVDFLGPLEARCVSFTEQLVYGDSFRVPAPGHSSVHIYLEDDGTIGAAVMQRAGGVFHPVLAERRADLESGLLAAIRRQSRRVYSVMGRTEDVLALESVFRKSPLQAVDYCQMTRPVSAVARGGASDDSYGAMPAETEHKSSEDAAPGGAGKPTPLHRMPSGLTIRRATPLDTELLFDIQRQYEIEEVLLPGNAFNAAASRQHLRETLRQQMVLFAEIAGTAVAKAGTNARGLCYDQIGGVFTEPRFRSRGISTMLMTRLLGDLARDGKGASLFVKYGNHAALRLYRKLGFKEEGGFRISYYR